VPIAKAPPGLQEIDAGRFKGHSAIGEKASESRASGCHVSLTHHRFLRLIKSSAIFRSHVDNDMCASSAAFSSAAFSSGVNRTVVVSVLLIVQHCPTFPVARQVPLRYGACRWNGGVEMPEYHFTGTATLRGVDFYITADTLEDARAKAARGEIDFSEEDAAEMYDFNITLSSGKENC
jgi:hypothetical protein